MVPGNQAIFQPEGASLVRDTGRECLAVATVYVVGDGRVEQVRGPRVDIDSAAIAAGAVAAHRAVEYEQLGRIDAATGPGHAVADDGAVENDQLGAVAAENATPAIIGTVIGDRVLVQPGRANVENAPAALIEVRDSSVVADGAIGQCQNVGVVNAAAITEQSTTIVSHNTISQLECSVVLDACATVVDGPIAALHRKSSHADDHSAADLKDSRVRHAAVAVDNRPARASADDAHAVRDH